MSFCYLVSSSFFFFNDTATTEIYTLSLHDALPIFEPATGGGTLEGFETTSAEFGDIQLDALEVRSEEHTSELQSQSNLVCRLLLEKKKKTTRKRHREQMTRHTDETEKIRQMVDKNS